MSRNPLGTSDSLSAGPEPGRRGHYAGGGQVRNDGLLTQQPDTIRTGISAGHRSKTL